ncbi:MAG: hypothetical protein AAF985_02915 [Bacteroidota bacterium]
MQYQKLVSGKTVIEFHNNWMGEETVIVRGQVVSRKSSVWGTNHYFTVLEEGHTVRYILTTRVTDNMQVVLDLSRNGELTMEGVSVILGSLPKYDQNRAKREGLKLLKEYDLEAALEKFEEALETNGEDAEIYFHMACAFSVQEKTQRGFECLQKAVANNLQDHEMILNHDMLAFLRMDEAFADFFNSGYTKY